MQGDAIAAFPIVEIPCHTDNRILHSQRVWLRLVTKTHCGSLQSGSSLFTDLDR
jgi:hypothetical protein